MIGKQILAVFAVLLAVALVVGPLQSLYPSGGFWDPLTQSVGEVWFWPLIAFVIAYAVWDGRKRYKAQGWPGVRLGLLKFVVALVVSYASTLLLIQSLRQLMNG